MDTMAPVNGVRRSLPVWPKVLIMASWAACCRARSTVVRAVSTY